MFKIIGNLTGKWESGKMANVPFLTDNALTKELVKTRRRNRGLTLDREGSNRCEEMSFWLDQNPNSLRLLDFLIILLLKRLTRQEM